MAGLALRPIALLGILSLVGCDTAPPTKSVTSADHASRRAYDGAPPVIPHPIQSARCTACHASSAMTIANFGVAPANPHLRTAGMSESSRCTQCHVSQMSQNVFVASDFGNSPIYPAHGERAHPLAPPTIPHPTFMREDCQACHTGAAARKEIVCTHPERSRCTQCHIREADLAPAAQLSAAQFK